MQNNYLIHCLDHTLKIKKENIGAFTPKSGSFGKDRGNHTNLFLLFSHLDKGSMIIHKSFQGHACCGIFYTILVSVLIEVRIARLLVYLIHDIFLFT